MGMLFLNYVMVLMMMLGGGTDLLDTLPTDAYWQAKNVTPTLQQLQADAGPDLPQQNVDTLLKDLQADDFATRDRARQQLERMGPAVAPQLKPAVDSKDPEVAAVAANLVKQFREKGQERGIRRLMAIRTLGERRENAALPLLKQLTGSKTPFVSDYALRAIAAIEGHPLEKIDREKEMAADLALLPGNLSLVAQGRGARLQELSIARLVDDALAAARQQAAAGAAVGGPPNVPLDRQRILAAATRKMLAVLEQVGNVRLDGVTLGVSDNAADNGGWFVLIFRGKYDSAVLRETIAADIHRPPETQPAQTDIPHLFPDNETALFFPSDDVFILVRYDRPEDRAAGLGALLPAFKTGKGTLPQNAELSALLKKVDTKAPFWGVCKPTASMRKWSTLEAVETFWFDAARKDDALTFRLEAEGSDAQGLKTSANGLNQDIQRLLQAAQAEAARNPGMQPLVDLATSMKATTDGTHATFVAEVKVGIVKAVLSQVGPYALQELQQSDNAAEAVPVRPRP